MSLGPFPMAGGSEFNKYGYFEAVPICDLSRDVQRHIHGFPDDFPASAEEFQHFARVAEPGTIRPTRSPRSS